MYDLLIVAVSLLFAVQYSLGSVLRPLIFHCEEGRKREGRDELRQATRGYLTSPLVVHCALSVSGDSPTCTQTHCYIHHTQLFLIPHGIPYRPVFTCVP